MATLALLALAGCASDPEPPERRAIVPPEPLVEAVSADPSAPVPSAPRDPIVPHNITSASSLTVVVTKHRPLDPVSYVPVDLVKVSGVPGGAGQQMRAEAAAAMTRMYENAKAAGVPFRILTAYRSYGFQQGVYGSNVRASGTAAADRHVARPGYSEHQTGLTADINDVSANKLQQSFGASAAGTWVREHAHEHGFIISYPEGAEAVTGYVYEPWHVRYVGDDVARDMHATGVATLQEYFHVEASPSYE
ncbi:MAG: M15 family metallopeptidase [Demequina sp.]|uniref:M15 family metallopeptidase n=1 Tax=Demequina sp. TaxID=2050685 RepID=UPI00199CCE19|nr:M15 family metallopeptidase [Demequina sp.]MBC7298657.1 M15 family metallopeptidase [Demequina sp.]